MLKLTGTFPARGADGQDREVRICTKCIPAPTHQNRDAMIEGLKELRTSEGYSVNKIGKGEYKIVQTGVRLSSDCPWAP